MAAAKPAKKADPATEADDAKGGADGVDGVDLPKKKISGKKMALLLVLVVLVLAIGAGAGLYFTGIIGKHAAPDAKPGEHAEGEAGAEGEDAAGPVFFEMPQLLVNLQSTGRRPSLLHLKISLQLKKEEDKAAVTAALPRVTDSFQLYLRDLSKEELQGTAGLERLREELRLRVSAALAPVEVKDVLFTEVIFGD